MTPKTEADLAAIVAGATGPLRIIGGGTRPVGNPGAGERLSLAGLAGIVAYEPGALTLVAQAGTPMAEIEAALTAEGQRLAFEPMDHRTLLGTEGVPTIGGVVAGNVSGPRRVSHVGACRDALLGVRFVDGTGRVLKNGGRVMKNVTGYDLVKLMAGSWGTLGVLSEVSFKVLPVPETQATLVLCDLDAGGTVAAMGAALGSPFEVSGAAHLEGRTVLRIEGMAASVAYRAERLQGVLSRFGEAEVMGDAASGDLWRDIRDVVALRDCAAVWRVSLKASEAPGFLEGLEGLTVQMDWGGGLLWIGQAAGEAQATHDALRAKVARTGGHVTLIKGDAGLRDAVSVFQPEPAPVAALSAGLRARFDPRGILNPGMMG
ncbi:FAD-binding protein [Lacimonas salitolerans]|uniref:FAD-binding protein n=1 Tax=Lacimonas salitolerans TaxID=1323750 RepID=A0ABW4EB76_9RHOB